VHSTFPDDVRVARQVRAAVRAGYRVDVVALRGPGEAAREHVDGATVFRLPVAHRRGAGVARLLLEYVGFTFLATVLVARKMLGRRYDVVQVHNPPDFLVAAALVPRLLGAGVALDIHDLAPDMFVTRFGNRPLAGAVDRLLRAVERAAVRCAHVVLTVHEPYRRELIARGAPADRTIVVMNSLDEELLPEPAESRADGFRIVYHGTLTPHYGVHLAVEALAELADRLPDARLEVYGSGDSAASIERAAREHGLAHRVTLTPELSHRAVLERIQGASAGVVPNLPNRLNRFALSTKLFEYVASGIPAIVASLPTLREHFADDEVWFFRPGDSASLAEAIAAVAAAPAEARRRTDAARLRATAYAWASQSQVYLDALDRAAGRST
jgi:glycosyltransferase involved in cell wall biosynthesis